jgi:hypothetical protein
MEERAKRIATFGAIVLVQSVLLAYAVWLYRARTPRAQPPPVS